ncbi:hypothetical protein D3C87_1829250 [compost metagenome]
MDLSQIGLGVFTDGIGQLRWVDVGAVVGTGDPLAVDVVIETLCISHNLSPEHKSPDAKGR